MFLKLASGLNSHFEEKIVKDAQLEPNLSTDT
jgi:hypothetical protein